jgi:transmembrane sensor
MDTLAERERIEEEASLWAARLEGGGMTDAHRMELARWLDTHPEHRAVLTRYRDLSAELNVGFEPAVEAVELAHNARRRHRRRIVGVTLAAAAAVALLFVVLGSRASEFLTGKAERHVALLEDGSRVELNAQTALQVRLSRSERRVTLARGEALFTVAKDPARPFIVETPVGLVRVTGTVFNIRADRATAERVEVTVLEGSVRVRARSEAVDEAALRPGAQAVLVGGTSLEVREIGTDAAENVVAWRQGQVVFDETPLREAIARFASYHGREVVVADDAADLKLGGRFAVDDFNGLLEAVERVLPVRIVRERERLRIEASARPQ